MKPLPLRLDRSAKTPLPEQIRQGISTAIETGVLAPGARLPSWLDLAAQLGVSRGTVRSAYDKLFNAQLIVSSRSAGTHVADRLAPTRRSELPAEPGSFLDMYRSFNSGHAVFQLGIPAHDAFPAKLIARIRSQAIRAEATAPTTYPNPQGELELRREVAAHLAIARGIECSPSQIIITSGFAGGLGLALRALGLEGRRAWMEDPGFPGTRRGLEIAKLTLAPIPVDENGIDVDYGRQHAPEAALAVVTPGQQAPLGFTLSPERRRGLLDWAADAKAWVIEDDYLSELQLDGRAAGALAAADRAGRVIHIGSFSKTISPTLRLGFVVVPDPITEHFVETAICLAPAPGRSVQLGTAEFMREGHYMRHLRRMKRIYAARRNALKACLETRAPDLSVAGLAMLLRLPGKASDTAIAKDAAAFGLAPAPLSRWYMRESLAVRGLLLGIATVQERTLKACCDRLFQTIDRHT